MKPENERMALNPAGEPLVGRGRQLVAKAANLMAGAEVMIDTDPAEAKSFLRKHRRQLRKDAGIPDGRRT